MTSALLLPFYNMQGSRMDAEFDAAEPMLMNRKAVLEFHKGLVLRKGADNLLETSVWRHYSCNELVAAMRVATLYRRLLSAPSRWLAGKGATLSGWSQVSSNQVLICWRDALQRIASDGSALFDDGFDPFAPMAARFGRFKLWREAEAARVVKAFDGTSYKLEEAVLSEARAPASEGGVQSTPMAIKLAEEMASKGLVAMLDPKRAIAAKLDPDASTSELAAATEGTHAITDHVESNFGCWSAVERAHRYCSTVTISALVQQMQNGDFEKPLLVAHDRRHAKGVLAEPPTSGFFHGGLNDRLRESLVEYSRKEAPEARKQSRSALEAQDAARLAKRESDTNVLLNAAVEHLARSKELFAQWQHQGIADRGKLEQALEGASEAKQLEILRLQIEMRTLGLGWTKVSYSPPLATPRRPPRRHRLAPPRRTTASSPPARAPPRLPWQFSTRWSSKSDVSIGTVAHLKRLLLDEIIPEERAAKRLKTLPTEAALPHYEPPDLGQLGTLDADAHAIASRAVFSRERLEALAEVERARRIEAGIFDDVEAMQEDDHPPFDQSLVGKWLEVCWEYNVVDPETLKPTGEKTFIWAPLYVKRVADGLTDRRSKRARAVLPAGMLLLGWEADASFAEKPGEIWLALLPSKWNPTRAVKYGWRLHPRELTPRGSPPEAAGSSAAHARC